MERYPRLTLPIFIPLSPPPLLPVFIELRGQNHLNHFLNTGTAEESFVFIKDERYELKPSVQTHVELPPIVAGLRERVTSKEEDRVLIGADRV